MLARRETMPMRIIIVVAIVALTAAGCAVSGGASAIAVRSENGQITADGWSGGVGCEVGPGAEPPCAAGSERIEVRPVEIP
jgi:hypothetical protein